MNRKIVIFSLIAIAMISLASSADHSGIKFGIDTNIIKLAEKVNLNKFVQNKTLLPVEGLTFQSGGFFSYKLHVSNLTVTDVKQPKIDIFTRNEGENQFLNVILQNLEISLQSSFNIEVIKIFKDQLVKSPINIKIQKIDSEFYFHEGLVKFVRLDVKIGDIDMKFNNVFFKIIYKIAKKIIINAINEQASKIHNKIEAALNNFITSQMLIDVGMGIGINATNVDRPKLVSYNKTQSVSKINVVKSTEKFLEFLADYETVVGSAPQPQNQNSLSSILEFGIHAALYPNAAPEIHPNIEEAIDMEYISSTFKNDITLLISDYTMNTLLFMVQQTGAMKYVIANDTNILLPFNIDTQSLGNFIPNLTNKYPENKLCEVKLYISAIDHNQPNLSTDDDGSLFTFNFGLDLNVFNSSEAWEDPNKEVSLNATAHAKLQYLVSEGKLNLIIFRTVVDQVSKKFDGLDESEEVYRMSLEYILNDLLKTFKPKMSNIDVAAHVESLLKAKINSFIINTEQKYTVLAVNIEDI
jgi:hypothetical protein